MTRSKPFWGQFWGQIGETDSYPHRANKCAALVSFEKYEYPHHRVHASEKPHKPVIKFYSLYRSCTQTNSTPSPHTAPVTARNAPVWAGSQHIDAVPAQPNAALTPRFQGLLPKNGFSCAGFTCTGKSLHK